MINSPLEKSENDFFKFLTQIYSGSDYHWTTGEITDT